MIILFGGSFNPPTLGHYEIIKKLKAYYSGALIILMPVGNLYPKSKLADGYDRLKMLEIIAKEFDNVIVSDFEIQKPFEGTIQALRHLSNQYQSHPTLAIGADNLEDLPNWVDGSELLTNYEIIVLNRNDNFLDLKIDKLTQEFQAQITKIDFDYPISASEIRQNIEANRKHLLPQVYQYIKKNSLYKEE